MVLVRPFTEADDVAGFDAARGILTSEGGKASHAALVARGMGRPCVCGASELEVDLAAKEMRVNGPVLQGGGLDCARRDFRGRDHRRRAAGRPRGRRELRGGAGLERRRRAASACAPTPTPPRRRPKARELGAEGIGLCRTEHMFMAADRQPLMRAMIMAEGEEERKAGAGPALAAPAGRLRGTVRGDGRPAGVHPAARPARCTSSFPTRTSSRAPSASAPRRCGRPTRCSAPGAAGCTSSTPRSRACRCGRSCKAAAAVSAARPRGGDHGSAGRLRERAAAAARDHRGGGGGGGERRHDDRAAARLLRGRPHRRASRLLLVRNQRPDPDRARLLARRRRGKVPRQVHRPGHRGPLARSRRWTPPGSGGWSGWPPGPGASASPTSSWACAASTAATPTRSPSSTSPAWTT